MAEETAQERTEAASPKRRQDARKKGQIARSRELSTSAVLLVSAAAFTMGAKGIYDQSLALLHGGLQLSGPIFYSHQDLLRHFAALLEQMVRTVLPFFLLLVVAALLAGVAIGGWAFSFEALAPDWTRLDPVAGIQRIISKHGLLELVKAVLKTSVVGGIGVTLLWSQRGALLGLIMEAPDRSLIHLMHIAGFIFLWLSAATLVIVLFDVPFQIWTLNEKLKMSRQEVQDEVKETDGNPQIKARVRSVQREQARKRMMEAVPKADVIVANPTHYAVALRYAEGETRAPIVLAKGADLVAQRIRELGGQHHIPVVEAPPLARALYYHVELEQEIPVPLYRAVAELLAYLYQLRTAPPRNIPPLPTQWSVPPELDPENKRS